mmetsp:Transcript_64668/g.193222  ORF Transcript_64668/g.193222 Transcript_64668/m.193222 type:complete len:96 (-) Transcript_64668:176-463(-)
MVMVVAEAARGVAAARAVAMVVVVGTLQQGMEGAVKAVGREELAERLVVVLAGQAEEEIQGWAEGTLPSVRVAAAVVAMEEGMVAVARGKALLVE